MISPPPRGLEPLEPRRLLTVTFEGFDIVVLGTPEPDVIVISVDPAAPAFYAITVNGQTTRAAIATTARIRIATFAGDDLVDIDPTFGRIRALRLVDLGAGDDTFGSSIGTDIVGGGPGDDLILPGSGRDRVDGGPGDDVIAGGLGSDALEGGDGNDLLVGAGGIDRLFGQDGHDRLFGGSRSDVLIGGDGNDTLVGGFGADLLAGDGIDHLLALSPLPVLGAAPLSLLDELAPFGTDVIDAGPDDDIIVASLGADVFSGGSGVNRIIPPTGSPALLRPFFTTTP